VTLEIILELVQLAINAAGSFIKNNPTALEQSLLDLVIKGHQAYEVQAGRPIDPTLIGPKDIIP